MTLLHPDATFRPQQETTRDAPATGPSNRSPASEPRTGEPRTGETSEGECADTDVAARLFGFALILGALAFAMGGWLSILF